MHDPLRVEVVQEAARLICEQGLRDYGQAKAKALATLGSGRGAAPSNQEIADCVHEYLRIFDHEAWLARLSGLRRTALQAMRLCRDYQPRAVGAVVNELATARSPVQIHLFCPYDEALDLLLDEQQIPFDSIERRYRHPGGQELRRPVCAFVAGEFEVELTPFGEDDVRWSPLSPLDGRPMTRWTEAELRRALEASA